MFANAVLANGMLPEALLAEFWPAQTPRPAAPRTWVNKSTARAGPVNDQRRELVY
jgi:hypothetical protein